LKPGVQGTLAFAMISLDLDLLPIALIAEDGGPINVIPWYNSTCRTKLAFSDKNPYPG